MILKTETISFKTTEKERAMIEKICEYNNITLSDAIRIVLAISWSKLEELEAQEIRDLLEKPFYL